MKYRVKRHAVIQPQDSSYRLIPLTKNQNAIVDAQDFEWLNQFNWRAFWNETSKGFRARSGSKVGVFMHSLILGCGPSEEVDHRNHNQLDNRRENLRKCTRSQNAQNVKIKRTNKSGFKGVHFCKYTGRWRSRIGLNGKMIDLGRFTLLEDAARAYDEASKFYHGEFGYRNFG